MTKTQKSMCLPSNQKLPAVCMAVLKDAAESSPARCIAGSFCSSTAARRASHSTNHKGPLCHELTQDPHDIMHPLGMTLLGQLQQLVKKLQGQVDGCTSRLRLMDAVDGEDAGNLGSKRDFCWVGLGLMGCVLGIHVPAECRWRLWGPVCYCSH